MLIEHLLHRHRPPLVHRLGHDLVVLLTVVEPPLGFLRLGFKFGTTIFSLIVQPLYAASLFIKDSCSNFPMYSR